MTDAVVATMVDTVEYGELDFQTYFVRHRWQPTVKRLRLEGIGKATLSDEIRKAVRDCDVIIVGPSNPWLSIDPILAVPEMRELILGRKIPRVAVSPIVGGEAIKGPAAKLMGELGYPVSAEAVAGYYGDLINGLVYDQSDAALSIPQLHLLSCETIMKSDEDKVHLARTMLEWIMGWK